MGEDNIKSCRTGKNWQEPLLRTLLKRHQTVPKLNLFERPKSTELMLAVHSEYLLVA